MRFSDPTGRAIDDSFDPVYSFDFSSWWRDWTINFWTTIVGTAVDLRGGLTPLPTPFDWVDYVSLANSAWGAYGTYTLASDIFNLINARHIAWYVELFPEEFQ